MITVEEVRRRERGYHTAFYAKHNLGDPGTWVSEPAPYAIESFKLIPKHMRPRALDLGSGIGRHTIPLAKHLGRSSEVVCIDMLSSANKKLQAIAEAEGVGQNITCINGEVDNYVPEGSFDYVLAVSCLEHVASRELLSRLIGRLQKATRPQGVHCFMFPTSHEWSDARTGEVIPPVVELNLPTAEAAAILKESYADWRISDLSTKEWKLVESVYGRDTVCKSTCIQFTAINEEAKG